MVDGGDLPLLNQDDIKHDMITTFIKEPLQRWLGPRRQMLGKDFLESEMEKDDREQVITYEQRDSSGTPPIHTLWNITVRPAIHEKISVKPWKRPPPTTEKLDWAPLVKIDLSRFEEPGGK